MKKISGFEMNANGGEKQQRYQTLSVYTVQYDSLDNCRVGKTISIGVGVIIHEGEKHFRDMRTFISCNNFSNNNSGLLILLDAFVQPWGSEKFSLTEERIREHKFHYPG